MMQQLSGVCVCVCVCFTFQSVFGLDDGVQWRRLDGLGQKMSNGSKSQQFDAQSDFMQWSPEDLWSHVSLQPAETQNTHTHTHTHTHDHVCEQQYG